MRRPSAAVALAALVVSCGAAWAQAVEARAASVTGRVLLTNGNGAPAFSLTRGYTLVPGDRVDTRGGGRVAIELNDGSMVVVQPESVIVIKDYRAASSLRELFEITIGRVRVKINHLGGRPNPYRINSPTASIAVRGTEFSVAVDDEGVTQVTVYEGRVEVSSLTDPGRSAIIEAGQSVIVVPGREFRLVGPAARQQPAADPEQQPPDSAPSAGDVAEHERGDGSSSQSNASTDGGTHPQQLPDASEHEREDGSSGHSSASTDGTTHPQQIPAASEHESESDNESDGHSRRARTQSAQSSQTSQSSAPSQPADAEATVPRPTPSAYDRYLAGLVEVGQLPFLLRYNAFPEAHLDSLENPAYATSFHSAEGRLFVLPSFNGTRALAGNPGTPGSVGSQAADYGFVPQFSVFAPVGSRLVVGGSLAASRIGFGGTISTFYSGSALAAARLGRDSVGIEVENLRGSDPMSRIRQTRATLGVTHEFAGRNTLGAFYRHGFIDARDQGFAQSAGHTSEVGVRLRGPLSRRLFYGIEGSWLGLSLHDGLVSTGFPGTTRRDRSHRASGALGLGYLLDRHTVLTVDLGGGSSRARSDDSRGDAMFLSAHAAFQTDVWRNLFVTGSVLGVYHSYRAELSIPTAFLPPAPLLGLTASRSSDYGAGWRLRRNLLLEYIYSTDYGITPASHSLILRYIFPLSER